MVDLFRKEFISSNKNNFLGLTLEITFLNSFLVLIISFIIITAIIYFITSLSYTKRNVVSGEITTAIKPINIFSQHQGYISEVYVYSGEEVTLSQKLYRINTGKTSISGNVGEHNISVIKDQAEKIKSMIIALKKSDTETLTSLKEQRDEYVKLNASSEILLKKSLLGLNFYESTLNDYRKYLESGLINKDQYVYHFNNYYQQQGVLNGVKNQYAQEKMQIINIDKEIEIKKSETRNKIIEFELKLYDLERQVSSVELDSDVYVIAPYNGKIESVNTSIGQYVTFNDTLIQLLPLSQNQYNLTLWVSDINIPYLKLGATVNIRYDAFPWQKFGQYSGHILEISHIPASLQEMGTYRSAPREELIKTGGNYYKVICSLKNDTINYNKKKFSLANGLTAKVTLFVEKRQLWQWILLPVYEFKENVRGSIK